MKICGQFKEVLKMSIRQRAIKLYNCLKIVDVIPNGIPNELQIYTVQVIMYTLLIIGVSNYKRTIVISDTNCTLKHYMKYLYSVCVISIIPHQFLHSEKNTSIFLIFKPPSADPLQVVLVFR